MNLTELCKFATSEIKNINADYTEEKLLSALELILRPSMTDKEITNALIQSSLEMTSENYIFMTYMNLLKKLEISMNLTATYMT